MKTFKKWLSEVNTVGTEEVDFSKVTPAYSKVGLAVKLVQLYDKMTGKDLLRDINTIVPLSGGPVAYGLYSSSQNRKVVGPKAKLIFNQAKFDQHSIDTLPNAVIKDKFPNINLAELIPSVTIQVNVPRFVRELGDKTWTIVQIASTIVHEATHEKEFQQLKDPNAKLGEAGPERAEKEFIDWYTKNENLIKQKIPEMFPKN